MSRESGQDRSQKTVAELLALHGGNVEGRRRHRRAADEEDEQQAPADAPRRARGVTETGPQAIIDRVRGHNPPPPPPPARRNGGRRAMPDDEVPPTTPPASPPGRRPGQQDSAALPRPIGGPPPSGTYPRPNGAPPPQDSGGFPRPKSAPPQESGAFARPQPAPPQESGAFKRPPNGAPDSGAFLRPNQAPPQESGAFQRQSGAPEAMPVRRPRPPESAPLRRAPQESASLPLPEAGSKDEPPRPPGRAVEETRQVPPLRRAAPQGPLAARLDGLDASAPEDAPDATGMAGGAFPAPPVPRRLRRAPARVQPEPEPHTEQFRAVNEQSPPPEAAVPPDAPPAGLSRWRRQRQAVSSEDTEVGVMPVMRNQPDAAEHPSAFAPAPGLDDAALEATGFHDPFADDDEEVDEFGDFGDFGEAEPERLGGYDYDPDPLPGEPEDDFDDEPEAAASPAKQWLGMAAQLALGVLGGAAVWLGFNWLWGQLPAAALVAALVVIVGLVWIVRKIRRADDIQTMVLAVLVGLVVTVSPAALLLLSR